MANNFRVTWDIYVSKAWNDANPWTVDLPKASVSAGLSATAWWQTLVIGTWVYLEPTLPGFTNNTITVKWDGQVILRWNGTTVLSWIRSTENISFENYTWINIPNASFLWNVVFTECFFKDIQDFYTVSARFVFSDCVFVWCSNTPTIGTERIIEVFNWCVFINTDLLNIGTTIIKNNYLWEFSTWTSNNTPVANNDYNNIRWKINLVNWWNPTFDGQFLDLAQHQAAYPPSNANSIDQDAKYHDISKLNFYVTSDSPHLWAGDWGVDIAIKGVWLKFMADTVSNVWSTVGGATRTDITWTTDLTIDGIAVSWDVISAPMLLNSSAVVTVNDIGFFGLKNRTGASGTQVPDSNNGTGGWADRNPNRLSYAIRWSTQTDEPSLDAEWDNQWLITAGDYVNMEWDSWIRIDASWNGTGDDGYDVGTGQKIGAKWIQVRVYLRNDRGV